MYPKSNVVGILGDDGVEIIIHVGIDSHKNELSLFTAHVVENQRVSKGDILVEFDIEAVKNAGIDITSPVIISNIDDYAEVLPYGNDRVNFTDTIINVYSEEIE